MKVLSIIAAFLLLAGCSMSNDNIIQEINKCKKAGMSVRLISNVNGWIIDVVCIPNELVERESK